MKQADHTQEYIANLLWRSPSTISRELNHNKGLRGYRPTEAAVKGMQKLKSKVKTVAFDNGLEFAEHETIGNRLNADVYFARPYAS